MYICRRVLAGDINQKRVSLLIFDGRNSEGEDSQKKISLLSALYYKTTPSFFL